jgi:hypothetical protein
MGLGEKLTSGIHPGVSPVSQVGSTSRVASCAQPAILSPLSPDPRMDRDCRSEAADRGTDRASSWWHRDDPGRAGRDARGTDRRQPRGRAR